MKFRTKLFIFCLAVPLLVGLIAGLATRSSMDTFVLLDKPPLSPPGWLFPVVWTVLYALMGIASYLVLASGRPQEEITSALLLYGLQLAFNFVWSFLFFKFELYWFSFGWLVALWILILLTILRFRAIARPTFYLLLPYLLWVTFAGYLNLGVFLLN